ncbi:MAG TPA: glutamate--cysteine ligase [Gammaproteobacteria bacterium]|nr:glutamate--cysteine ligase [Gammaproteobacteria bacterium]
MGQEISRTRFSDDDFARFQERVAEETRRFSELTQQQKLSAHGRRVGFELEAWLVDHSLYPAPINSEYLAALRNPLVVPELSRFNVELNGSPQVLRDRAFSSLEAELRDTWQHCLDVSHRLDSALMLIGILPTIRERDLTMANASALNRFKALNEQILSRRGGRPITVDIEGVESLHLVHDDVMLEAAATSFQVHLQVPAAECVRYYNASLIASAPVLALGVNSPFLFNRLLWQETRIPLFEQAVAMLPSDADPANRRVSFGSGYLQEQIDEYFLDNLRRYPVLLPIVHDTPLDMFAHLRLHNGTIWRWNRPLVGFDDDGTPHVRIEHRVLPAGPSLIDMLANAALYTGLVTALATQPVAPETGLPFPKARANFYAAARYGLEARLHWMQSPETGARELLEQELLPLARHGLRSLDIHEADIERYFDVLSARVRSGQTGAAWQRAYTERHGRDFLRLSAAYLEYQRSGAPVHEWGM